MKWLGIGAGVVLAGIVGIVALLPRLIDWNAYRPEIAALAGGAIGLPVAIDGAINAALFPTPQVTAGRIRILGLSGGQDIAAVRWAEAQFKFSDLLRGNVTLTSLALVEPDITLSPTVYRAVVVAPSASGSDGADALHAGLGGFERRDATRIDIRNGTVVLMNGTGALLKAERVSGSIETPTVGRRIVVSMTGEVAGRALAMDMRLAPPQQDGAAPLAMTVSDRAGRNTVRLAGVWTAADDGIGMTGEVSLNSIDAATLPALVGDAAPPVVDAFFGPLRLDGDIAVEEGTSTLRLTNLNLNTDAVSATGALALDWSDRPKADLTVRVGRLDLDVLKAPTSGSAESGGPSPAESAAVPTAVPTMGLSQAESRDLMAWIGDLPVDVTLDFSLAGARLGGTVVRRISMRGAVDRGTVTLEELSAQLPGGTDLSIAGFGDMTGAEPLLEGNATLRSDDLRRLLDWAGLPVPEVSADRLRRFSLVSGISLRPRRLDIIDAAVELDGVTATAAAAVALRRRLGIGLRVSLDHINLDAYRPVVLPRGGEAAEPLRSDEQAETGDAAGSDATAVARVPDGGLWSRFDASLDLSVGRAVALGIPFSDVIGNLVLKDGILTVNEMAFQDAGGISGSFGGQMAVDGPDDSVVLAFEGAAQDLGRFSALLEGPDALSDFLRSLGKSTINASYQPAADGPSLILDVSGAKGGFSVGARPGAPDDIGPSLDILSGGLQAGSVSLTDLAGRLTFPPGQYQVEKLSGTLNGGRLYLSGGLRRRDDGLQQLLITGALDDLPVDRELADLDGAIGIVGRLSVRGQGEATGSDWRAMSALNEGWFDVDGQLAMRMGPERPAFVRVKQVVDVRRALQESFSRSGHLNGTVTLRNGILQTEEMILRGPEAGTLALTGRLGLYDGKISAALVLRENPGAPQSARLIAEGPAEAPNLRLEGAGSAN